MRYREEALRKYRTDVCSSLSGPKATLQLPKVSLREGQSQSFRLGPLFITDRPPVLPFVEEVLSKTVRHWTILEIGPGNGMLASRLQEQYLGSIVGYYGIDRDAAAAGRYTKIDAVSDIPGDINLAIASEVIEHMSADDLQLSILEPLLSKLSNDATLVISTPNPTSPGGIARDFTHVQNYPWYDLYAILRLAFHEVEITRVHYAFNVRRLIQVLPRIVLCGLLELEWCDQLVAVARQPRKGEERVNSIS